MREDVCFLCEVRDAGGEYEVTHVCGSGRAPVREFNGDGRDRLAPVGVGGGEGYIITCRARVDDESRNLCRGKG